MLCVHADSPADKLTLSLTYAAVLIESRLQKFVYI